MSSSTIGVVLKSVEVRVVEPLRRAVAAFERKPESAVLYALVLTAFFARMKYQ